MKICRPEYTLDERIEKLSKNHKAVLAKIPEQERQQYVDSVYPNGAGGWVYIVHQESTPYFKIGVSKSDVHERVKSLQIGSALKLSLVLVFYFDRPYKMEKHFHRKFKERNVKNSDATEWFVLGRGDWVWLNINFSKYMQFSMPSNIKMESDLFKSAITQIEIDEMKQVDKAKRYYKYHNSVGKT